MIYIRKGAYDCVVSIQNNVPEDEVTQYGWMLIDEEADMDGEEYLQSKLECSLYDDELRPNVKYIDSLIKFTDEEKEEYFNTEIPQTDPISVEKLKEELDNKAEKIAVLSEDGSEVVKKIDLGFKMLEEEGNVTKGQLIDQDTKGVLYPETTYERILNKPTDNISGYIEQKGNTYSGAASDYGVELHKVVGKTVQETTNGYQLFDASKISTKTQGGATVTNSNDGSFKITGSGTLSENHSNLHMYTKDESLTIVKEGTITLVSNDTVPQIYFGLRNAKTLTFVNDKTLTNDRKTMTITQEDLNSIKDGTNVISIGFYGKTGNTIKTGTVKPMVYQDGDGTWEQYTGGKPAPNADYPMEVKNVEIKNIKSKNKNLFNLPTETFVKNGVTAIKNIDGSFTLNGTVTGSRFLMMLADHADKIKLEVGQQYTLSIGTILVPLNSQLIVGCYKSDAKTYIANLITFGRGTSEKTETIQTEHDHITAYFEAPVGSVFNNLTIYPMLEVGDAKTEFVDSKSSVVETSITLAEDDVYENGSITKAKGHATFDGSSDESWSINAGNVNGYFRTFIDIPDCSKIDSDSMLKIKCNRFDTEPSIGYWTNPTKNAIVNAGSSVNGRIAICFDGVSTVDEWKSWLQSHPLEIEYPLQTPTTEELKVPTIPSYYPNTNIWTDSIIEPIETIWRANTTSGLAIENKERLDQVQYDGLYVKGETYSGVASNKGMKLHSVKGKTEQQTTTGKNILPNFATSRTHGGVTYTVNSDKSITIKGTASGTSFVPLIGDINDYTQEVFKVDEDYVASGIYAGKMVLSGRKTTGEYITIYSSEYDYVDIKGMSFGAVYIQVADGYSVDTTVYPQIELGSEVTPYEPYTGGVPVPNPDYPMPIENVEISEITSHGRNLLPYPYYCGGIGTKNTQSGIDFEILPDKSFKLSGTATSACYINLSRIEYGDDDSFSSQNYVGLVGNTNKYITLSYNPNNKITSIYVAPNRAIDTIVYPMISKGKQVPEWEAPTGYNTTSTNLTLAQDDIYQQGTITRARKQVTFDGSSDEKWTTTDDNLEDVLRFKILHDSKSVNYNGVCNRFPYVANYFANTEHFYCDLDSVVIFIKKTRLSTQDVAGFKTWLSTHNLVVEYELATPITEEFKVPTIPSYYPNTNIWTDNTLPTDIEWELLANSDNSLDIETLEKRIAALEKQMIGG